MQDMVLEMADSMEQPEEMQEESMGFAGADPQEFVEFITQEQNIAQYLADDELRRIGALVIEEYQIDKTSMSDWEEKMQKGIDLAKLVKKDKSYPFTGSANIKYPLITSAALQFNARAYPAIIPNERVVHAMTYGKDPQGLKAARADRVSEYMSYQLVNEIEEWEEQTDRLLVQLPIVGTMVRKLWFDNIKGRPCAKLIDPGSFIVNDKVKSLSEAPRASEEMSLYPYEMAERVASGDHLQVTREDSDQDTQAAQMFIEQHRLLDLNDDGYDEPYIVTVHQESQQVVRIVADFMPEDVRFEEVTELVMQEVPSQDPMTGEIVLISQPIEVTRAVGILSIESGSFFIDYHFLPSLDGGFWGTGLGLLLADISDTINTIMNMLIDAGHYASLGGGFIGSEFRLKGGAQRMAPGEYRKVQANGQDIRSAVVPIAVKGPDATLYQMLGMLIEAGREIASVKDVITGDAGGLQNAPATTTLALIEQGQMVFTAAYKRIFRSLKKEYKLLSRINSETVTPEQYNAFLDDVDEQGQPILHDPQQDFDYSNMDVCPAADPRSVTKMQEFAKAELVRTLAGDGMVDPVEASKRILEAASIQDVDELAPKPDPMQEQLGAMQMQGAQADLAQKMVDVELTMAKVEAERAKAAKDLAGIEHDEKKARLDGLLKLLEMQRDGLAKALENGPGRGQATGGGMEITPGLGLLQDGVA